MLALQDERPARVQMIKDTRSAIEGAPVCAGDTSWYFFFKKSVFARETRKHHVLVGEALINLGVSPAKLCLGFTDPDQNVDSEVSPGLWAYMPCML